MMDPLADIRASQAERSSRGAAGGESADDQTRGCGRDAARGGSDSMSSFADMEDSLEEKLKGLAFRKQISYSESYWAYKEALVSALSLSPGRSKSAAADSGT
ncbi:diacylglycerol kinase iota-like protein [Labeo rohita]|uniref:Diacylglycerol kinase iota-like protein n=1 Tax=Labeo rohita TaxID=84645 RepID=A0A498N2B5_LABRO|nr:diacylglycerol kinase iota-like protein [Labeo rohita]